MKIVRGIERRFVRRMGHVSTVNYLTSSFGSSNHILSVPPSSFLFQPRRQVYDARGISLLGRNLTLHRRSFAARKGKVQDQGT
jgi:hypothetical protein